MLDHPPNDELLAFFKGDVWKCRVARFKFDLAITLVELFNGNLPIDHGHNDASILGLESAVDDQQIPIEYSEEDHRMPTNDKEEGGRWVCDQLRRQVYAFRTQVFRRRGETGLYFLMKFGEPSWA
jgi:hypothetical protein